MRLRVEFRELLRPFAVRFSESPTSFSVNLGEIYKVDGNPTIPIYDGVYTVTPSVKAQTLNTAQRVLQKNIEILQIPYAEVTNNSKGKTVTIG